MPSLREKPIAGLSPEDIRHHAVKNGCMETGADPLESVIAFKTRYDNDLHIYYDTGTVVAITEHPRHGPIGVFQHNVDLSALPDLLINPLQQESHGYKKVHFKALPLESEEKALRRQLAFLSKEKQMINAEEQTLLRRAKAAGLNISAHTSSSHRGALYNSDDEGGPSADRAGSFNANKEDIGAALNILMKQQSTVNAQIESYIKTQQSMSGAQAPTGGIDLDRNSTRGRGGAPGGHSLQRGPSMQRPVAPTGGKSTDVDGHLNKSPFQTQKSMVNPSASTTGGSTASANTPLRQRGNQCCYALANPDYHREFGVAWSSKPANVVALGTGYVIIYDDGSLTWWDVPELLQAKLKDHQAVKYVSLGSDENYYVKLKGGKMEWCGPDSFGAALKAGIQKQRLLVDRVAFAPNQGWLILWSDGSLQYSHVPQSLQTLLDGLTAEEVLKDISIGPNEEWFCIFKDNSVRADNLSDSLFRILTEVQEASGRVRQVIFGENSSWYVRYWDGKAAVH